MIRGFRRILNLRSFVTSKDPQDLKQQFQKLTEIHNAATQNIKETEEEIKLKDQVKATEELKSKFQNVKENLGQKTGEAKSVFQRASETFQNLKSPTTFFEDLKSKYTANIKSSEKQFIDTIKTEIKEDLQKTESKAETPSPSNQTKPEDPINPQAPEPEPETIRPTYFTQFKEKNPKVGFALDGAKSKILNLWNETFPKREDKVKRLYKMHQMRKMSVELDEKLSRGEITEEELPQWKKSALMVVEEKKSKWSSLKEKISGTSVGNKIQGATSSILEHDSLKTVKTAVKDFKTSVTDAKEVVRDALDDADIRAYQKAKEYMSSSVMETPEAKAIRHMRQWDPEFDIYVMELELPAIMKPFFEKYLVLDKDYVGGVASTQILEYMESQFEDKKNAGLLPDSAEVIAISKCVYLGVNTEDKSIPKFSYSFKVKYIVRTSHADAVLEKKENEQFGEFENVKNSAGQNSNFAHTHYFVTFTGHPDPDILKYGHPWQFLVLYPSEGATRVN